ncbi:MAG: ribulose-phosphate 3-epimerase [Ruminococcus sp.]|nr:ribulose-phosphate 3-epimerase [Ruminococcus sp.]
MIVSVSVLSADFSCICEVCSDIKKSGAEWVHFDVMDGLFVDNITFGTPILKSIATHSNLINDVHLMISNPIKYIEDFAKNGADYITFHYESNSNPIDTINKIHECGKKAGISIKPNTPVADIENIIGLVDMVLIMTVEPGFGGQGFIYETLDKINQVRKIIQDNNYNVLLEVDGGINLETSKLVRDAGANVLVSGSYLFKQSNMSDGVKALKG